MRPVSAQTEPFYLQDNTSDKYAISYWNTETGLQESMVHTVLQDPAGYLLLGCPNGIYRFDGNTFQKVKPFPASPCLRLSMDAKGKLWPMTTDGFYSLIEKQPRRLFSSELMNFAVAHFPDGRVLVSQFDFPAYELALTSIQSRDWETHPTGRGSFILDGEQRTALPDSIHGLDLAVLSDTSFVVGGLEGLYFSYAPGKYEKLSNEMICGITQNTGGNGFAFLTPSGLYIWDAGEIRRHLNSDQFEQIGIGPEIVKHLVSLAWRESTLVIGGNRQVLVINTDVEYQEPVVIQIEGLNSRSALIDKDANIWIGTVDKGLYRLTKKLFTPFSEKDGLPGVSVSYLHEGPDSTIWVGTYCHGTMGIRNGFVSSQIVDYCNYCVTHDSNGNTFLANEFGLEVRNGEAVDIFRNELVVHGLVYATYRLEDGTILFGIDKRLVSFSNGVWNEIAVGMGQVHRIQQSSSGKLLICTNRGLWQDSGDHSFKNLCAGEQPLDVRHAYELPDGTFLIVTYNSGLWVLTSKGLEAIDKAVLNTVDLLSFILKDDAGRLWLTSNGGVYVFRQADLMAWLKGEASQIPRACLKRQEGMLSIECNGGYQESAIRDHSGHFWIPTVEGVLTCDPQDLRMDVPVSPMIDAIMIGDSLLPKGVEHTEVDQASELEILYSSPELRFPGICLFEYRLQGFNDKWIPAGDRRRVRYESLPPGKYTFEVRRLGNPMAARISITVPPLFWQTFAFWIPITYLFLALIIFFVRYRIRIQVRKKMAASELERQLTRSKLAALQAQLNPHFVFNCLSSIQHLFLIGDERRANTYMTEFSSLLRLTLEYSREMEITLQEEIRFLEMYADLEKLQFKYPFSFEIKLDPEIDSESILLPAMSLQPFVENAIQHGMAPLNRAGKIEVRIMEEPANLVILIEDDGVGRQRAAVLRKDLQLLHPSRGAEIMVSRFDLLSRLTRNNFAIETNDLQTNSGTPCGTQVKVTLPLNHKF